MRVPDAPTQSDEKGQAVNLWKKLISVVSGETKIEPTPTPKVDTKPLSKPSSVVRTTRTKSSSSGSRVCKKCGVEYALTRENFGSTPSGGFRWECRACKREKLKAYTEANPETFKRLRKKRRSQETKSAIELRELYGHKLFKQQNGRCFYTGVPITLEDSHIDHKIPVAKGGTDTLDNIVLCSAQANLEKHAKTVDEYRQWRKLNGLSTNF
jgi:5-methylcytosine-specific restriction endonuclease McrA